MTTNKIRPGQVLRKNYRELILVFSAFALMVVAAYFSIGHILQNRLFSSATEMVSSAGVNVRAGLAEAETTLLNSYYIVQQMVERNADSQEIFDYFTVTTEWMRQKDQGLLKFYGIFGYINGELYDSMGINPSDTYIPQRRPWYQAAIRSGDNVVYTVPYEIPGTGDIVISAVRNMYSKSGDIVGILVVDIDINWLQEYVSSLSQAPGGYGILLSQNMTIMAHPRKDLIGSQLQDISVAGRDVAQILRNGGEVQARRMTDINGNFAIVFFTHIFNGWYVGIITPYFEFYQDMYLSLSILIGLGLILALLLSFIEMRLSAEKMRADEDSKSKSSFLANMSHEIRTPMNAITGMAELMLRTELSDEARSYAQDIKHAGANLLSIINDLLDFSKIEAGKLEIIPAKYMLSSLVNDAINIIRIRLVEKPIQFFTSIDANIPKGLFGDEVRVRQIVLNLLSNAAKYSEKGHICLSIMMHRKDDKQVWLKITVSDTGKGIKAEDLAKLFGEFVQLDTKKNRGIEGTGLGLAITKRLCNLMGGDISVESEYGKGSVFTVVIPQDIDSNEPFAAVEDAAQKKVLVYEDRPVYADSVCWSLQNMGVPFVLTKRPEEFINVLSKGGWFYVFAAYNLYENIKPIIENFPPEKQPRIALLVEWGTEPHIPNTRFVSLPIQSLSIANVLNGKADGKGYADHDISSGVIRFTIPTARLLVVDDISTNLKVAEGLLSPYHAKVDTCQSGVEAIELVQQHEYDIVFMDHMMPEMDGIEATAAIRALADNRFKTMPIIALTANAVVGMREMFIGKGLNDFLAKPIDVSKLDEILVRWIAKEKREKRKESEENPENDAASFPDIPGVDTAKGIAMTGGTVTAYKQVIALFRKDAQDRLHLLKVFMELPPPANALPDFTTHVHALKSASASLGAAEVSAEAARLEAAGKAGDIALIKDTLPAFMEHLAALANNIGIALEADSKTDNTQPPSNAAAPLPSPLLDKLAEALQSKNASEIDNILEELMQQPLDSKVKKILEQISDEVLMADYDKAGEILDVFRKGTNQ